MTGVRREYRPRRVLNTWREVMQALPHMNEKELRAAINVEKEKPSEEQRKDILLRLHRRYCVVRQDREMEEIGIKDFFYQTKSRSETPRKTRRDV